MRVLAELAEVVDQRTGQADELRRLDATVADLKTQLAISRAEARLAKRACASLVEDLLDADIYVDDPFALDLAACGGE